MAFTTGTATNYFDLLDKLRQWLTGTAGWTELAWSPSATPLAANSGYSTLSLKAPGSGLGRETYVNIRAASTPSELEYWWQVSGAVGYQGGAAWGNQPGEGGAAYFNTWQNAIDYRFYANDRRFIVIAKCSTIYISLYAGFILPWAVPDQYPFPLMISADFWTPTPYNTINSGRRMFCDPGAQNAGSAAGWCRDPSGTWNAIFGQQSGTNDNAPWGFQRGDAYFIWPYSSAADINSTSSWAYNTSGSSAVGGVFDQLVPTAQGDRLVLPAHLNATRRPALGALDGVYCPLGAGIVTEQVVNAGGLTLRAFQNIHRNSANDIFLINEV